MWPIDEPTYFAERDLPVYERELRDTLPDRLFDVHAHLLDARFHLRPPSQAEIDKSVGLAGQTFGAEDMLACLNQILPGKDVRVLIFGGPFAYTDLHKHNAHISNSVARYEAFEGLLMPWPGATEDALEAAVRKGGLCGFKPYDAICGVDKLSEVTIEHMLTPACRAVAERLELMIMLHVPRKGRILDPDNIREVRQLSADCPHAKIVIAHVGRSYEPSFIEGAIDQLKDLANVWFDMSAVDDPSSMEVILRHCGHTRLLYGSDLPITLIRGKHISANYHPLFLTRKRYSWSISGEGTPLPLTLMLYESLRALNRALRNFRLTESQIEDVYHNTAAQLVASARQGSL